MFLELVSKDVYGLAQLERLKQARSPPCLMNAELASLNCSMEIVVIVVVLPGVSTSLEDNAES